MAPSLTSIKNCLLMLALLLASALPTHATAFTMKRGLNLDQWVTWPMEDKWHDEAALLPFPEWRRFVDADKLAKLKADGFDFVRMPVDPAPFLSERSAAFHAKLYSDVLDAAREVNAAGLKVVVDLHLIERNDNPANGMSGVLGSPETFARYLEIVRRMGRTLADEDPSQVALELMNEPGTACDAAGNADWASRLSKLYAAARSSATRLTLVLTGGCAGNADGLVAIDPGKIPDDNVIWTFHNYQPFLLTHQGATWAGDFIRYVTGLDYPLDPATTPKVRDEIRARIQAEAPMMRRSGMLAYLDELLAELDTVEKLEALVQKPFDDVEAWAGRHGIAPERIFLGEFGMIRQEYQNPHVVSAATRASYVRDIVTKAEAHGYSWAIWGYGGAFGVVEEFDGRAAEPDVLDVIRSLPEYSHFKLRP